MKQWIVLMFGLLLLAGCGPSEEELAFDAACQDAESYYHDAMNVTATSSDLADLKLLDSVDVLAKGAYLNRISQGPDESNLGFKSRLNTHRAAFITRCGNYALQTAPHERSDRDKFLAKMDVVEETNGMLCRTINSAAKDIGMDSVTLTRLLYIDEYHLDGGYREFRLDNGLYMLQLPGGFATMHLGAQGFTCPFPIRPKTLYLYKTEEGYQNLKDHEYGNRVFYQSDEGVDLFWLATVLDSSLTSKYFQEFQNRRGKRQNFGQIYTRPPDNFDKYPVYGQPWPKERVEALIREEMAAIGLDVPLRLMSTEEWSYYLHNEHFVPLTLEGLPEDFTFDYNWVKGELPKLPTAEVVETGELYFWWERGNYYDLTEEQFCNFINTAVSHEGFHYGQWQAAAYSVLIDYLFLDTVQNIERPRDISDLERFENAVEVFMNLWCDHEHYQCREVEVYVRQMENGQISIEQLEHKNFHHRLNKLKVYNEGNENCEGCKKSVWNDEFEIWIQKADSLWEHWRESDGGGGVM